jgi:hypothetical protein
MRLACSGISSWFAKNATVVTPSPLLARVAAEHHSQSQLDRKLETWRRPVVHGIGPWLAACWQEARYNAGDLPTLLSPAQERALWHGIIEQQHPRLFDIAATVRLAGRAADLLAEWHIQVDGEQWNEHPDAQQFQMWLRLFRKKCRDKDWITRADLWRLIPEWVANRRIEPSLTVFLGFQDFSPAFLNVQRALGSLAVQQPFDSRDRLNPATLKRCSEFPEELDFTARHIRFRFEKEKSRSIGVFVPELAENSALVERVFTSVLFPGSVAGLNSEREPLFHVKAGRPLLCCCLNWPSRASITLTREGFSDRLF